jgi:hypothetical protein
LSGDGDDKHLTDSQGEFGKEFDDFWENKNDGEGGGKGQQEA